MKKTVILSLALGMGLVSGLAGMDAALACCPHPYYQYYHHWHPSGRFVSYRGCRRIVNQQYCKTDWRGYHHCYMRQYVRWVC